MKNHLKTSLGVCAAIMAVWALLGGSAMYWGLRLASGPEPAGKPEPAMSAAVQAGSPPAMGRALGASPSAASPPAATANRFVLMGVVAGSSGHGAALISVDGKPARPFRPGAAVAEGLVLQAVLPRRATLGPAQAGPAAITLEMAPGSPSASTDKPAGAAASKTLI